MNFMRRLFMVMLVCVLLIGSIPVNASKETFVSKTPAIEEQPGIHDSDLSFNVEDSTVAEAADNVSGIGQAADELLAQSAPPVQADDIGDVEITAGVIGGNAQAGISEPSDENADVIPKIGERGTMRVLDSKTGDVEPMSIDITLDKTTVAVGETVTANWTISGVVEPYSRYGYYWTIYYTDGTSTYTSELSDLNHTTSFTPDRGVKCQLCVYAFGADGRAKSAYSDYVTITGAPPIEPMSIDITLDKTIVEIGETVTANWTISGVVEPYSRYGYYWTIYYTDGTSTYTPELSDLNHTTSFTPDRGVKCQLCVYAFGADGRAKSAYSDYVTITGAPPIEPMSIDITLDKTIVEIGETVTANWTISGVVEPYSRYGYYWTIYYTDGTSTYTSELSDLNHTTSFTPDRGVKCQLCVYAFGADGRAKSAYSGYVTIISASGYVKSMTLNKTSYSMHSDDVVTLVASPMPTFALDRSVTWSSSNESIARVSAAGVVTAKAPGTSVITATANDGSNVSASCTIEVLEDTIVLPKAYMYGLTRGYASISGTFKSYVSFNIGAQLGTPPYQFTYRAYRNGVLIFTGTSTQAGVITLSGSGLNIYGTYTFSLDVTDSLGYKDSIVMGERMTIASGSISISSDGSTNPKVYATSVSMNKSDLILGIGATGYLSASVLPINATNKNIKWKSSNPDVASISENGAVTGNAEGSVVITAMATDGSMVRTTCSVTVRRMVESIAVSQDTITLHTGETETITATISPANATIPTLRFETSDSSVATVNESGEVAAHKAGTATIKISATDGSGACATVRLQVLQYATGVVLDKASAILYTGKTLTITPTISPDDASDKGIAWTSGDEAIATVADGVVTAIKAGSATITATTSDGSNKSATCEITVKQYATGVTLDKTTATLYTGDALSLQTTITPDDASDPGVTWASSNETVATVMDGVVTALKAGTATITATAADGSGKSAACVITVKQFATGVMLDKVSESLYVGGTMTLEATVSPSDTSDKQVTWSSNDETVATVSSSGVVTGVKEGSATITATTADSSEKSASCEIAVWVPASGVTIDPAAEALLKPGDVLTLTANVQPENAHDRSVTWSTSNASVARVDDGAVTAVSRGTATITATTHNGKTATCAVAVEDRVVDLTLSVPDGTPEEAGTYSLPVNATLQIGASVKPEGIGYGLTYKSFDAKIASVSRSGLITGLKNGRTTVTVTAKDSKGLAGKSKTLTVSVFTPVSSVSLPGEVQILTGEVKRLTATVFPSGASDKALTWASDNKTVATVAPDGTVTANAAGTATITATAKNGQSALCQVRVTDPATEVQITTETGNAYVNCKATLQLNARVSPGTANEEVTWKSNNTDCVTVGADGRAYGRKVGKATVYATATDGTGVRGQIAIQVITPMKGVVLPEAEKVFIGKAKKLSATLSPSSATFKALDWKSDNESVATVAPDGTVTAKALGTAMITATAYNGRSDSCTITVTQPVEKITITQEDGYVVVYRGETVPLNAAIAPDNASEQGVTWKSSNTKYATVNERGEVTGKAAGKVTITATAKDGSGVSDSINLTIVTPETAIKLSRSSVVLYHNGETDALKTLKLTASALPKGAQSRTLTWSVESGDAATVDETTGLVTALKEGIAVIRATTGRGYTADCEVMVRTLPASFTLNTTEKTLAFKQSFNLGAEAAFDAECTEPALTWTASNKKVATVSSSGVVKAGKNKTGTTVITATTKNGKTATCMVTVVKSLPNSKDVPDASVAEVTSPRITLKLTGGDYATSDGRVADVAGHGEVMLKQDGAVTLEAGGKQIGFIVEDGNLSELKVDEGAELLLTAGVDARWTVKDGEIAAIDRDGRLTALRKGTTTLTCQANDGGEWTIRIVVTRPDGGEPQTDPELSAETEQSLPEPAPETEPTVTPEPEPAAEPTAAPEPEPSVEPEPTAKPEPEKAPDPKPDGNSAPAPTGAGDRAGAEG